MKELVTLVVVAVLLAGCATTITPNGLQSGIWTGNKVPMYNPSQRVDPSQTAYKGVEGHAAALALGDIDNPEARTDAKEAMIAISENASFWGRGSRGIGGFSTTNINGRAPVIAGTSGAYGRMYNPFEYPITVVIRGLGSPYTFGPGEEQELLLPHGKYDVVVYNTESRQLMGHNHFGTLFERKYADKVYNFNVRLDAESAH